MKRISHNTYATVFGVVYLGLMTNLLLLASCLPFVVLLVITDPALSWPMLAVVAPLCAPGITAAFATFRAHGDGDTQVVRTFVRTWKRSWRKAMLLGAVVVAALVVVLVDVRFFAPLQAGVAVVPLLAVLTVLVLAASLVAFAALAEERDAALRSIARAALFLSVRRWWLSLVSLAVIALQAGLFVTMPAVAIGLSAAPALYLAWANARYILRPVLGDPEPRTV
ncbi:DUF624 domain-containing protein [Microbacterium imperiale]|uniref:Ferredoxin-NADPH reductase n=1 Tax=Microbacterium imperiale TaxID=33884 RepID=A0A9W6HHU8_9MICO|nr:DUF624 domain-containing protein [Microbacterium imperiale]MBP2421505.1 putative membrane protein YesL [Microbacterium imperiale]MDS0199387.1 DUF624 domain-containing protein [Microbacterium imperiale]BFE41844.1 hypothetical protein GCM10017544_28000 [Microbacterium imperiale]GLJ80796.1 hypothetical protein GCM10017586_24790 [Microbacterium imperiale]